MLKIILLSCFLTLCYGNNYDLINMLISFLTYDDAPSALLVPYLCWNRNSLNILTKNLNAASIGVGYSFQNNRSERFLQHVVILADLSCPSTDTFIIQANKDGYFMSPYRWMLLDTNNTNYLNVLDEIDILINSDVVIARKMEEEVYLFIEAYKINEKSEVIYTPRSTWRPVDSRKNYILTQNVTFSDKIKPEDKNASKETIIVTSGDEKVYIKMNPKSIAVDRFGVIEYFRESKVISSRRKNLRRHALVIALVITDSNETKNHLNDRLLLQYDSVTRISYAPITICLEMLNSTEKVIFTNTWGYRDKDGNWQGLVRHLMRKEADLGTLTLVSPERMEVIEYLAAAGSTAVRFVFREPPLPYITNIFTLPFTGAVWLASAVSVLACALFLFIASKWESSMCMHPLQLDGSWADVLILIIGAVLQQGCTLEPRRAAGRLVTLLLFISLTILYAAYSANIVVLLRAPSSSVRTLQDLLTSPLKLGASDFEYNRYFMKNANDPIRKAIYNKKIAPKGKKPQFFSMKEGVEKIRQGLFAFNMELNPGYRLIQKTYQEGEKCDLVEIDYLNLIDPWLPGQKRGPLKDLFKINFMKIRESGLQAAIRHRLLVPRPTCSGPVATFSSVGITDMYPALLATSYGFMMAPAVLIIEILYHRLKFPYK